MLMVLGAGAGCSMEVVAGNIPDKDSFKQQIAEAKLNRTLANKAFNKCGSVQNVFL